MLHRRIYCVMEIVTRKLFIIVIPRPLLSNITDVFDEHQNIDDNEPFYRRKFACPCLLQIFLPVASLF